MSYTKNVYIEHGMSEAEKIIALNLAETQYDETTASVAAHNHDDIYYTQDEADDLFFGPAHQGDGSGMDAGTLDGYTSSAIIGSSVPTGLILMTLLAYSAIPEGWQHYSTMDGRHPIGANATYKVGVQGGNNTADTSGLTITSNVSGTLSANQVTPHAHSYENGGNLPANVRKLTTGGYTCWDCGGGYTYRNTTTDLAGSGSSHSHSLSVSIYGWDCTPKNAALTFMKKIAQ